VLPHVVPGRYLHEMVAAGTGTSLRWFRDALGAGMSDGEARSGLWNQIKADVMGRPLRVAAVPEAPAVGAAILAGMAAGAFASAEAGVAALTGPAETVAPDPADRAGYEGHRARWEAGRAHVFAAAHD
jgi:xylulokinase